MLVTASLTVTVHPEIAHSGDVTRVEVVEGEDIILDCEVWKQPSSEKIQFFDKLMFIF